MILLALASCGGGGGSSAGSPTPPNQPPAFTSAKTVSIPENTSGVIYQAAATDPEGSSVTFKIAGGDDAARFAITSSGALSFVSAPDYDLPTDANRDNVYDVSISASDGSTATTVLDLSVTVTNLKEGIAVHRVASGFTGAVSIWPVSETEVLVGESSGAVYRVNPQTGDKTSLGSINDGRSDSVKLLAIAATSVYLPKPAFFAMYQVTNGSIGVDSYFLDAQGNAYPGNVQMQLSLPTSQYQGGGWLGIDANGNLLVGFGDGIDTQTGADGAQDDRSRAGKLIRVTPNPDPYAGASIQYYLFTTIAKGLHAPTGGTAFAGGLLLADSGKSTAEEVDEVPDGAGQLNFGWPFEEGTHAAEANVPDGLTAPVLEYPRKAGDAAGEGIVGGAIGPNAIASLSGKFVFADAGGAIFSEPVAMLAPGSTVESADLERRDADFAPDAGTINHPVSLTSGQTNTIYILDEDGDLFRVDAG